MAYFKKERKEWQNSTIFKSITNHILMFNAPDFPLAKSEKRKF
jgi:hypothetical protein